MMKKEDKIRKYDSGNRKHNIKKYQEKKSASGKKSGSGPELSVEEKRKIEKDFWKAGNMLYPLPAVMVSCQRPGEKPNIITVAWAATVCSNPAMLSISVRPERYSYDILRETKEFVVNLTTRRLAEATDFCGVCSGREVDKFKKCI